MRVNRELSYYDRDYDDVGHHRHRLKQRNQRHDKYPLNNVSLKSYRHHHNYYQSHESDSLRERSPLLSSKRNDDTKLNYRQSYSPASRVDHHQINKINMNEMLSCDRETIADRLYPAHVCSNPVSSYYPEKESNRDSPSSVAAHRLDKPYSNPSLKFYKSSSYKKDEQQHSISRALSPIFVRKTADAYDEMHRTTNHYTELFHHQFGNESQNRNSSSGAYYSTPSTQHPDTYRTSLVSPTPSLVPSPSYMLHNHRSLPLHRTRDYEMKISHRATDRYEHADVDDNYDDFCHPSYKDHSNFQRSRTNFDDHKSRRFLRR